MPMEKNTLRVLNPKSLILKYRSRGVVITAALFLKQFVKETLGRTSILPVPFGQKENGCTILVLRVTVSALW